MSEVIDSQCSTVYGIAKHLDALSDALLFTGNSKLANDLSFQADKLRGASEAIRIQHHTDIHEAFYRAEQSSRNLLNMGLVMSEKGSQ